MRLDSRVSYYRNFQVQVAIGNTLVESPDDIVPMTGGTDTGVRIIGSSKDTVKEIALELGGEPQYRIWRC